MKSRRPFALVLGGLFVGLFLFGIITMIQWKFDRGDMYPRLSSLRSDPLGSRVLYEALNDLDDLAVDRNFSNEDPFVDFRGATVLFLNLDPWDVELIGREKDVIEFVASGGRVVLGMNPGRRPLFFSNDEAEEKSVIEEKVEERKEQEPLSERGGTIRRLMERLELTEISEIEHHQTAVFDEEAMGQQGSLVWRKRFAFEADDLAWKSFLKLDEHVVGAYRQYGKGSIVILGDDYLFSNEAMYLDRSLEVLDWIIGDADTLVFDEAHFGISESTGITGLIKKYQLLPVVFVCFILLLVWIWKNAVPLLPARVGVESSSLVVSESSSDFGLSELINRSVPPLEQPLRVYDLWKKSILANPAEAARYKQILKQADEAVAEFKGLAKKQRDPNELYFKLKDILNSQYKAKV
ncbi:MAG: DUF4350 domain-containing protein [Opitutales bacterium]